MSLTLYKYLDLESTVEEVKKRKSRSLYIKLINPDNYQYIALEWSDKEKVFDFCLYEKRKNSNSYSIIFPMKGNTIYVQSFKTFKNMVKAIKKRLPDKEILIVEKIAKDYI